MSAVYKADNCLSVLIVNNEHNSLLDELYLCKNFVFLFLQKSQKGDITQQHIDI